MKTGQVFSHRGRRVRARGAEEFEASCVEKMAEKSEEKREKEECESDCAEESLNFTLD